MPDHSNSAAPDDDRGDLLNQVPQLPIPGQRWTARCKAAVIEAVRGGWVPIEEACRLYNISVDEFLAWERDIDRNGVPGLRSTRYQIYRDTDPRRSRACQRNRELKFCAAGLNFTCIALVQASAPPSHPNSFSRSPKPKMSC